MPSASAKLEKQTSTENSDPVKQVLTIVEKRVRNLEKRKAKLDSYKTDFSNGKELNDDQKKAIEKYDQVVEVLEFAKEMQKSFNSIVQETAKMQKKAAKREQVERQQHELQRIKEIVIIQDILNSMGSEDVRKDFLNGANGAFKLTEAELNSLDELYKLVCPDRTADQETSTDFDQQLCAAAEHIQALLDSKHKDIIGTTYKALRETITKIHSCGYFNKSEQEEESEPCDAAECETNDVTVEGDSAVETVASGFSNEQFHLHQAGDSRVHSFNNETLLTQQSSVPVAQVDRSYYQADNSSVYQDTNHPIQDVLSVQGNLNFLQESQIELESSRLDPSTVSAHSIASNNLGYPSTFVSVAQSGAVPVIPSQHLHQRQKVEAPLAGHITPTSMISSAIVSAAAAAQQPVATSNPSAPQTLPVQSATPQADFDPARPIPTQTYTNQSFATVIHPMMSAGGVPGAQNYVPITLAHAIPSPHILQANVVAQSVQSRSSVSPPVTGSDPNTLSVSAHSQHSGLSVTSMSKANMSSHEAKEQYVSREFQVSQQQMVLDRNTPQTVQSTISCPTSHYENVETSEGTFSENVNNTFGNNRGARSGARESRSRGATNMYPRGTNQPTYGNDRGYQSTNNNQGYANRENLSEGSSYSSNLKRGLPSTRGVARGNSAARGANAVPRGNRTGYRNQ